MSEANVEIVRRVMEAASSRPGPDFDTINALVHPAHEFLSLLRGVEGRSWVGASGYRKWLKSTDEAIEYRWTAEETTTLDEDHVLVRCRATGQGRGSGVPLDEQFWGVVTVRDGRVTRTEVHASREQALHAARAAK